MDSVGYKRALCSVCGEGLGFSESDPHAQCEARKVYILAGHKNQFHGYVKRHNINPQEAVFVTRLEQLRGVPAQTLIRCGTWWEQGIRGLEQIVMRGWTLKDEVNM